MLIGIDASSASSAAAALHPVERTELVAVRVPEVGEIELHALALAYTRRILDGGAARGEARRMPGLRLLGGARREAERRAVGGSGRLKGCKLARSCVDVRE